MGEVILTLRELMKRPIDLSNITPDIFARRTLEEIGGLKVWRGNRETTLKEIFEIKGEVGSEPGEVAITLKGDLSSSRRLGKGMTQGRIVVEGDVGMYLGEGMKGGSIQVKGDAGAWAGVAMKGGLIEVEGDAGDFLAAAYRGIRSGMEGGTVIVHGSAGSEVGGWMKGGVIKVQGGVGVFPGVHMQEGALLIGGDCQGRAGADMKGGKVVLLGSLPEVLPGFRIDEIRKSTKVGGEKYSGPFYVFLGDAACEGEGKLFIHVERNPHLKRYEGLLEGV